MFQDIFGQMDSKMTLYLWKGITELTTTWLFITYKCVRAIKDSMTILIFDQIHFSSLLKRLSRFRPCL